MTTDASTPAATSSAAVPGDGGASAPIVAVMITDVGVVRDHNEDAGHVDPQHQFFIVADGMGGHAAGEVASAMAVETVRRKLEGHRTAIRAFAAQPTENGRKELVRILQGSVLAAHQAVFQRSSDEEDKRGMGTTLDVVLLAGAEAFVAHVGDSRTYLLRDGRAAQVTTDHTVAEVLVIEGKLTVEEAAVSPLRTVLVNAVGVSPDVGVEMAHLQLRPGDRLLLCSDGLHDYFTEDTEVVERLGTGALRERLQAMVDLAKERGGHDNITGISVDIVELPDAVPAAVERDSTLPVTTDDHAGMADDWEADRTEAAATAGAREQDLAEIRRGAGKLEAVAVLETSELGRQRRAIGDAETVPPASGKASDPATDKASPKPINGLERTDPQLKVPADLTTTLPARGGPKRPKK